MLGLLGGFRVTLTDILKELDLVSLLVQITSDLKIVLTLEPENLNLVW